MRTLFRGKAGKEGQERVEDHTYATADYYTYDGDGQRVKKSVGGHGCGTGGRNPVQQRHNSNDQLYWHGPGGEVLAESDLAGTIKAEYIYFGGKRLARRDPSTGVAHYYLSDHLGTARVMVTASGTVVEESDFLPYGVERVKTDTITNNYKFTGHERDAESGLDHTLYRQYASMTGRWLAPDPLRGNPAYPQSWNRYSYGSNSPTNLVDADGACPEGSWTNSSTGMNYTCINVTASASGGLIAPTDVSSGTSADDWLCKIFWTESFRIHVTPTYQHQSTWTLAYTEGRRSRLT